MSSDLTPSRPSGVPLAIALLSLGVAVFFSSQISASSQQSRLMTWQMKNGTTQIENAKKSEENLNKLIDQQGTLVKQVEKVQAQYQELFEDLLKIAEKNDNAKAIVEHWKIQRADNKPAAAAEKPADKPK